MFLGFVIAGCSESAKAPTLGVPPGSTVAGGATPGLAESDLSAQADRVQARIDDGPDTGGPLEDVVFSYDSFELSGEGRETLRRNASWLQNHPQVRVEIEGHCDERGTVEYNLALGAKRARSARDYLVSLGIRPDRLSTISYGEELPACREQTESCWQLNRRAHLLVLNR